MRVVDSRLKRFSLTHSNYVGRPAPRCSLLVAGLSLLLAGCQPANLFHGRFFVINSTGGAIRSPTLVNVHPGLNQTITLPDLADGQAWVGDFRCGAALVVLGDLKLSYVDRAGDSQAGSVPFWGEVPDYCRDDFFIEVDRDGRLGWGLLVRRDHGAHAVAVAGTHALAGVIGLLLGWLLWRRGRTGPGRSSQPNKAVTSEL